MDCGKICKIVVLVLKERVGLIVGEVDGSMTVGFGERLLWHLEAFGSTRLVELVKQGDLDEIKLLRMALSIQNKVLIFKTH